MKLKWFKINVSFVAQKETIILKLVLLLNIKIDSGLLLLNPYMINYCILVSVPKTTYQHRKEKLHFHHSLWTFYPVNCDTGSTFSVIKGSTSNHCKLSDWFNA